MQSLLRKAATVRIRARPRRVLGISRAEAHTLRPIALRTPFGAHKTAPPPSGICRTCWQARYFSSDSSTAGNGSKDNEGKVKTVKKSEPLRILFCGSDDFSCVALGRLYRERERDPTFIESIDVVVRPGKRAGRGNKVVVHPPIRELAENFGLPIHERDTFRGWDMPPKINIIIAVSFGLFVPPRLLRQARYGGLNVHPSLLPDFRGPAPLHHTLLAGREYIGVTLQTLDVERFDHGKILAQTPALSIPPECTYKKLLDMVTPIAADLLIQGLRGGVYVPPLEEITPEDPQTPLLHAPKITKADRQILPPRLPDLLTRFRALGSLWLWSRDNHGTPKRVIFEAISDLEPIHPNTLHSLCLEEEISPDHIKVDGMVIKLDPFTKTTRLAVRVPEDRDADYGIYIGPHRVDLAKVEGAQAGAAAQVLRRFLEPVTEREEKKWKKAGSGFFLP
ncbi:Formyltransferase [Annulohypoxylon moriforme]|nr:Formyltransferase [Annulohypoxylon moriforme]